MDWYRPTIQLTDKKDRMRTAKYSESYMLIPKYPILSEIPGEYRKRSHKRKQRYSEGKLYERKSVLAK